jgi:hypothetical protein
MAFPTQAQWEEAIKWILKEKQAELQLFYGQQKTLEELAIDITPSFRDNYTAFGDDVQLQSVVDGIKADLERPEELTDAVNNVLGISPTNDEIDSIVALLNAAKV